MSSQPTNRSVVGRAAIRQKQDRVRRAIGRQILELRMEAGVTQRKIAAALGIDQAHISRIERGLAFPSIDVLVGIAAVLGADTSVRLFPIASPRLRDHLQAPMVEAVLGRLNRRWVPVPELPVPAARGVIDLALRLRDGGFGVACEFHSQLRSIDLVQRRLVEKTAALAAVEPFGPVTSSLLVVRSTALNRDIVRAHRSTLSAAFPASYRMALEAIAGNAPWPGPSLLWVRLEAGAAELVDRQPRGLGLAP